MCRRQPGIGEPFNNNTVFVQLLNRDVLSLAIGRLCEKCDGKWYVYSIT